MGRASVPAQPVVEVANMEVFDRTAALERLGGDDDRLQELMQEFQATADGRIAFLEQAVQKRSASALEREAESLGHSAHLIGAEGLNHLARQMMEAAQADDFEKAATLVSHMGMELEWLERVLDEDRCSGNL